MELVRHRRGAVEQRRGHLTSEAVALMRAHRDGPPLVSNFYIPQTFVIDKHGRLIANETGAHERTDDGVQELVRYMLADGE